MLDIFNNMEGVWKLYRNLGKWGEMYGQVKFTKLGDNLSYHCQEEGLLSVVGKSYKAYRAYGYSYKDGKILVHFWNEQTQQQGDLLHELQFPDTITEGGTFHSYSTYNCNQDIYKLHFIFNSHNSFKLNYQIVGPYKDYIIQTKIYRE
jgi:hypothetical protein